MSQASITVYIPFLANVPKCGPYGGYGGLKKYVKKAFAKSDIDGAMTLGTVKKVDIVIRKADKPILSAPLANSMMIDDNGISTNDSVVVSAYVKFVPSMTKSCSRLISEINSHDGLRFIHNTTKSLFWNIYLQRKQRIIATTDVLSSKKADCKTMMMKSEGTCPKCGEVCSYCNGNGGAKRAVDNLMVAFESLTCDDGPCLKRTRYS